MNNNNLRENIFINDPFVRSFLARIPLKSSATFNDTQLAEIKRVFNGRTQRQHYVDIRVSLPLFKERFYIVFLLGKEIRSTKRLQNHVGKPANKILLRLSGFVIITSLLFTLYMVNQLLGNSNVPGGEIQTSVQKLKSKN